MEIILSLCSAVLLVLLAAFLTWYFYMEFGIGSTATILVIVIVVAMAHNGAMIRFVVVPCNLSDLLKLPFVSTLKGGPQRPLFLLSAGD